MDEAAWIQELKAQLETSDKLVIVDEETLEPLTITDVHFDGLEDQIQVTVAK